MDLEVIYPPFAVVGVARRVILDEFLLLEAPKVVKIR
jgi:hypothetical protein